MHKPLKTTLTPVEAAAVACICFGLFVGLSIEAVFNGFPNAVFSDAGVVWMISLELVLATIALIYLKGRHFDIGSLYPAPTFSGTAVGLGLFAAAWAVAAVGSGLVGSTDHRGLIEFSFERLSLPYTVALSIVNGTFEEVFLLGALVRGLRGHGLSIAIGVPLLVRALCHLYQGPAGVVWVTLVGATFTLAYVIHGRLWPPVLAHMLWDIVPIVLQQQATET